MAKKITTTSGATKSGSNKIIWFAGAIALGVGAYFGWKWWKKRKETASNSGTSTDNQTFQQDESPKPSSSSSSPKPSSLPTNPFTSQADLKKFQEWVISVKKDTSILGSAGADGIWGTKSGNAWSKYGAEYTKSTTQGSGSGSGRGVSGLDKDTITVLVSTRNNGYRVAWGNKATENYIKTSKYPTFFNAWKDAVLRRIKDGGNTLFFWGGSYYDSYTGSFQVKGSLSGRGIKAGNNTFTYTNINGTKGNKVSENTTLGQVSTWRYEFKDNMLWIKSSNGSWYKYPYIKLV
jgi:hypothetical protein